MKKNLLSGIMAAGVVASSLGTTQAALADELEQQVSSKTKQIAAQDQHIDSLLTKQNSLEDQLKGIQTNIVDLEGQTNALRGQKQELNEQISELKAELKRLEKSITKRNDTIKAQARSVQVHTASNNSLDMILNADSVSEAVNRLAATTRLMNVNRRLVEQQKDAKKEIEKAKAKLNEKLDALKQNEASLQSKTVALRDQQLQEQVMLKAVALEKETAQGKRDQLEKEKNDAIVALRQQREREAQARIKAQQEAIRKAKEEEMQRQQAEAEQKAAEEAAKKAEQEALRKAQQQEEARKAQLEAAKKAEEQQKAAEEAAKKANEEAAKEAAEKAEAAKQEAAQKAEAEKEAQQAAEEAQKQEQAAQDKVEQTKPNDATQTPSTDTTVDSTQQENNTTATDQNNGTTQTPSTGQNGSTSDNTTTENNGSQNNGQATDSTNNNQNSGSQNNNQSSNNQTSGSQNNNQNSNQSNGSQNNSNQNSGSQNNQTKPNTPAEKPNKPAEKPSVPSGNYGSVAEAAKAYLGVPYVWGGTTPAGFDCSGLTSYVYRQVTGKDIGRVTTAQENAGTRIPLSQAQAGDLVFFGPAGATYHVGIYLGDGTFIHAPQPGESVKITPIQYYTPDFAVRVA